MESIVRRTLQLEDHRVQEVRESEAGLEVQLEVRRRRRLPCSGCGKRAPVRDRLSQRSWRHVPLWGIAVRLLYRPARVRCATCGVRVEMIPWGEGKGRLSRDLVSVLAVWSRRLPWQLVAELFGVSWATVRAAVERAVAYGLAVREDESVLYIGIDEISRRRGHIYHTQVYDLGEKRLLWSGEDRQAATLRRFLDEWGPERCARIRAVCCDMWAPYLEVLRERIPQALIVFDKFHLIRHLLRAVDDVRKREARELKKTHPDLLAGTRYLWLKNPWNLTPRQLERLGYLQRLNLKIHRAYLLKETFQQLWRYRTRGWAKRFLAKWFWWATHSRLAPMRDFARLLRRHQDGILAWFSVPLTNAATEAMNANARAISYRARGYRSAKTFTLSQLHCLGRLQLPPVLHRFA
ncbi:MAG: ISL3 family transposase [Acidobacteria bacterium]|nr:ISL3 family transposase [Acidobacteriota bacterium]